MIYINENKISGVVFYQNTPTPAPHSHVVAMVDSGSEANVIRNSWTAARSAVSIGNRMLRAYGIRGFALDPLLESGLPWRYAADIDEALLGAMAYMRSLLSDAGVDPVRAFHEARKPSSLARHMLPLPEGRGRPVACLDDGSRYPSVGALAAALGVSRNTLYCHLRGEHRYRTVRGKVYRYA